MFIPIHLKSDFSLGYGTASIEELVRRGKKLGYPVLALTDLENLAAQIRFHHECRSVGIRPVTGIELRPGFDGRRSFGGTTGRIVLLAADRVGYRSLCRIVSGRRGAAGVNPDGRLPGDPLPLVIRHPEGLFALSDDPEIAGRLLASGAFTSERLGILLVRPGDREADLRRREAGRRLGLSLVADLDAIFLHRDDHALHVLQSAIRRGIPLSDAAAAAEPRSRLLRSPGEVESLFADIPEAVAAAAAIAESCRLDLTEREESPAGFGFAADADDRLRRLCDNALAQSGGNWDEAHRRRIADELGLFGSLGFSGLILAVGEILAQCRRERIPVATRGSAVSSLVLHLLGGSPVDPLRHGLILERFLHPGKSGWPDVDIDLPWDRRDEVIDRVSARFGRDRVATVAAIHTFRPRSALREGLKVWGAGPALIERLSALLPPEEREGGEVDFLGLAASEEQFQRESGEEILREGGAEVAAILPVIRRLVGKPRHLAAHTGGILIGSEPLAGSLPLERAQKGVVITQYDAAAIDRLGLVKIDLLGNRCLSELDEVFRSAKVSIDTIPRDDPATLSLIDRGETVGCFQLESPAIRSLLVRLPIRSEADLTAALALIRPGAAAGEAKETFLRRSRGEEPAEEDFPILADRLAETHGLLLYEEDLMLLLSRAGRMTLGEADELRSAIIKSGGDGKILAELERGFLEKGRERGAEAALARRAWREAARLAAYTFNKAHAASYARLAYLSAFTKVHYPAEFAAALLNHHQGLYPLRVEAGELARMGVRLLPPHVNHSGGSSAVAEPTGGVRVGLDRVKGLSRRATGEILAARESGGEFMTLHDLLERVRLTRGETAALVLSGACDRLHPLTAADYPFPHDAALERLREGAGPAELDRLRVPAPAGDEKKLLLYRRLVRARNELRYLEMHLSDHPMALLREEARRYRCVDTAEAARAAEGTALRLAVTVAAMKRVPTREGPMQFLTVEDETGLLEAAILPEAYRRMGERIVTPGPFLVEGRLRRRQGAVHLEVTALAPFHRRVRPYG